MSPEIATDAPNERQYMSPKVSRDGWPAGPWDHEPDKIQWLDKATDYDCLIVRNRVGALCGYVGVPPEHPCHGAKYNDLRKPQDDPEDEWSTYLDVHGGLTFGSKCHEGPEDQSICHVPLPGRTDDVFWFGFDCAHHMDYAPGLYGIGAPPPRIHPDETYRTVEYVRAQVTSLAAQLVSTTPQPKDQDDD